MASQVCASRGGSVDASSWLLEAKICKADGTEKGPESWPMVGDPPTAHLTACLCAIQWLSGGCLLQGNYPPVTLRWNYVWRDVGVVMKLGLYASKEQREKVD